MPTIYLVRHGENPANISKEFSYRAVDYSLNEKGREQARQTAEFLARIQADRPIGAVWSSPLRRAAETAQAIAAAVNAPLRILEAFREVNVGSLEGQAPTRELWDQHNQVFRAWLAGRPETAFPDGEDHHGLCGRMQAGLREVLAANPDRPSVIVGHGGIFTATLASYCPDIDLLAIVRATNHNCSITELEVEAHPDRLAGRLVRWADYGHLTGAAAEMTIPHLE